MFYDDEPLTHTKQVRNKDLFLQLKMAFQSVELFGNRSGLWPSNCTPPAIAQFPSAMFTQEERAEGAVLVHVCLALYMFAALVIVCDNYFVPACKHFCELAGMSTDVAGATFMAAGSSAPVLAATCIGVFIAKNDIGLGSVVGAAAFNIFVVVGVCALLAHEVLELRCWPILRDCLFYVISIVILIVIILDSEVHWYEAAVLLLVYVVYIGFMNFNSCVEQGFSTRGASSLCCSSCCMDNQPGESTPLTSSKHHGSETMTSQARQNFNGEIVTSSQGHHKDETVTSEVRDNHEEEVTSSQNPNVTLKDDMTSSPVITEVDIESAFKQQAKVNEACIEHWPGRILDYPETCAGRAFWIVTLPLSVAMCLTIPHFKHHRWRHLCFVTFFMSVLWIIGSTYLMVWMIAVIGYTMGIPDTVMGLTFIAAGSSLPDTVASVIVAREGLGDMAVSNAVASNVFDILFCLGVPWLFQTTVVNSGHPITVYSSGFTPITSALLLTAVVLVVSSHVVRWRLTRPLGVFLLVVFAVFITMASLSEANVFGYIHPPECLYIYSRH